MQNPVPGSLTLLLLTLALIPACDENPAALSAPYDREINAHSTASPVQFKKGERVSVFGLSFVFPSRFEKFIPSDDNPPKTSTNTVETAGYSCFHEGTHMVVVAEPQVNATQIRKIDDYLVSLSHQPIVIGSLRGKRYEYDEDGYHNLVVRIETASHSFVFHTATNGSRMRHAKDFLNSISGVADSELKNAETEDENERPNGTGRSGPDGSSPFESSLVEPTKTPVLTKLMILSKPRPSYTLLARIYHLQGTVILRAKFNADGTIEHVKTVKPLPFGLTGAAVQAMMKIKFTPRTKNGIPESVLKNVEYTFTIF